MDRRMDLGGLEPFALGPRTAIPSTLEVAAKRDRRAAEWRIMQALVKLV